MAPKRLLENPMSASSSSSSGEEIKESAREDNHHLDSDSETDSDNNVSAFKIMPIASKSAVRVDPEPEKSGDAIVFAADETPKKKKKNKKMKSEKGKSSFVSKKPDQKSSDPPKKVNKSVPNNTVVGDDEMAEPSDEPTIRVIIGLPSNPALEKKPKTNKSAKDKGKVVGDDKIVVVRKRLKGKKKDEAEKIESLTEGLKGKKKVEVVVGAENENENENLSLIGDGKGVWWEDLSKIEIDKAEKLKEKWKQLREEELELFILKNELLMENAIAVIDAMKASHS